MVEWKKVSKRKKTGGVNKAVNASTKKLSDRGGTFAKTTVAESDDKEKRYSVKTRGGNYKNKISQVSQILVSDGNKTIKGKILDVVENSANKHFVRQKIITKGSILKVKLNDKEVNVKVTSRPGQSGIVSGILIKGK